MYVIQCQTSGGVTGFREALLKDENGNVMEFATEQTAQAACPANVDTVLGARIRYWVTERVW